MTGLVCEICQKPIEPHEDYQLAIDGTTIHYDCWEKTKEDDE